MKDLTTNKSRGFGFVTFHDAHSVDVALSHELHTIDYRLVSYFPNPIYLLLLIFSFF